MDVLVKMNNNIKEKICGVVIIYNPRIEYVDNIKTYVNELDKLYVIDNSDVVNLNFIKKIEEYINVTYVKMKKNSGIGYPINWVIKQLKNIDWLLTMDQDSYFYENDIKKYLKAVVDIDKEKVYGITLNIWSVVTFSQKKELKELFIKEKGPCITSGMLLNVNLAKKTEGFNENLFIDLVDTEYCFRQDENGFILLKNNKVNLIHSIGEINQKHLEYIKKIPAKKYIPFVFMKIIEKVFSYHSDIRWYYISRNTFYLIKKYHRKRWGLIMKIFRQIAMMLLFEKNKFIKIKYIIIGFFDFKQNTLGKKF